MQLSKNFTLEELVISQTAARLSIDNTPSNLIVAHLERLTNELLEPIRAFLGFPVHISSGYRCPALNRKIGGVITSAHCFGFAADITAPQFGSPQKIAEFLAEQLPKHGIKFDQIIWEFGDWVHVAVFSQTMQQRGQVLTARKVNGETKYFNGIVS